MPIRTRRWNDSKFPGDGWRLLICRFRPRGLPTEEETWHAWWKELGPSPELHAAFYGKAGEAISVDEYRARFLEEMKTQAGRIEELATRVRSGETITLLCSAACKAELRCHRILVQRLIEEAVAR